MNNDADEVERRLMAIVGGLYRARHEAARSLGSETRRMLRYAILSLKLHRELKKIGRP